MTATGGVVLWYTSETQKMRRQAEKQTAILAEQLKLVQEGQAAEQFRQIQHIRPLFTGFGGTFSGHEATLAIQNRGGPISSLAVSATLPAQVRADKRQLLTGE